MMTNYVEPNKNLMSYTCPHCHTLSQMEKGQHYFPSDAYDSGDKRRELCAHNLLTIHKCQCCGKKILWMGDTYIYPDIVADEANPAMPESVRLLYKEAALIYNKSPRAACALLRLAVERLCNELGETDRDINKNIGALVNRGLPILVQQALDVVRVVGNKAVHPGQLAFDVDDKNTVAMLMRLLNIIVERMIVEPQEIDMLYQALPESVKNAIENRDKK